MMYETFALPTERCSSGGNGEQRVLLAGRCGFAAGGAEVRAAAAGRERSGSVRAVDVFHHLRLGNGIRERSGSGEVGGWGSVLARGEEVTRW